MKNKNLLLLATAMYGMSVGYIYRGYRHYKKLYHSTCEMLDESIQQTDDSIAVATELKKELEETLDMLEKANYKIIEYKK